jgi:hypothetical protein
VGWAPAERLSGTCLLLYAYAFASDKSRRICRSPDSAADRPPPSRESARQTRGVSLNPVLCALVNCHQNQFGDGGDENSEVVFRSKFWSAKIHCSISFVFGNNCPTID